MYMKIIMYIDLVDHIIPFPSSEDIFLVRIIQNILQLYGKKQILQNRGKALELITIKVLHGLIMFLNDYYEVFNSSCN